MGMKGGWTQRGDRHRGGMDTQGGTICIGNCIGWVMDTNKATEFAFCKSKNYGDCTPNMMRRGGGTYKVTPKF